MTGGQALSGVPGSVKAGKRGFGESVSGPRHQARRFTTPVLSHCEGERTEHTVTAATTSPQSHRPEGGCC